VLAEFVVIYQEVHFGLLHQNQTFLLSRNIVKLNIGRCLIASEWFPILPDDYLTRGPRGAAITRFTAAAE